MTDQEARYDRIAEGYAAWWAPVHRPGTLGLLDEVEADVAAGARRLLDVGCGTGHDGGDAVRRWPDVELDARRRVGRACSRSRSARRNGCRPRTRRRLRHRQALADELPFDDGTFDLALSAFVLQLVPSRYRALREMRRVLRPGARLAYVTWLRGGERFRPDDAYDEARQAVGLEPRWDDDDDADDDADPGNDDVPSPEAAVAQLRRAGFAGARPAPRCSSTRSRRTATSGSSPGSTTRTSSRACPPTSATALEHQVLERLRALPAESLVMRLPIVYATGIRSR